MTNSNGGENMSAQKRKNMLIGFGGLAIALVVVIALVSPNFRSEDARGAIGAVQKHRAPQIAQSDVVLGDEQTKQDQQAQYSDFLTEAAALQNISADLASESQSVDARVQMAAKGLDARSASVQARYQQYAKSALDAMQKLGAEDQLGKAAFQDLSARVSASLQASDMDALNARLSAMSNQLAAARKESRSLGAIESQLNSFALAARESQSLDAASRIENLQSAIEAENLGARLRVRASALDAAAKEAKSLAAASIALQAKSFDAKALGKMSAELLQQAEQLEARAVKNMESSLAAHAATAESLGRMRMTLDAANKSLDARASTLDAKSLQAARISLAAFNTDLQARNVELQARSAVGLRSQLAAVNSHLEARSAVGARSNLASAMVDTQNFAARGRDLAARVASLQAKQQ
ncbi:MAG: hypothetical protein JJE51_04840 [Thermoanaerobaculia bacterium]|nr:hypothetical protein [Thermoanaerobaculia bacterium]